MEYQDGPPFFPAEGHRLQEGSRREVLLLLIDENPALNIEELALRLGTRRTSVKHHVRILVKKGLVTRLRRGRHVFHFPVTIPPRQQLALALLRMRSVRAAVESLFIRPDITAAEIAEGASMTPRAVRRAIQCLVKNGLATLDDTKSSPVRRVELHPELRLVLVRWRPQDSSRTTVNSRSLNQAIQASDSESTAETPGRNASSPNGTPAAMEASLVRTTGIA